MVQDYNYEPVEGEPLSMAVVSAISQAHDEGVLEQNWILNNDINPDALDDLFQDGHANMTLQFKADSTTVTIDTGEHGIPAIHVTSHR